MNKILSESAEKIFEKKNAKIKLEIEIEKNGKTL